MSKQERLLDIDSCNRCKHLDIAKSGRVGYVICRKENRVVAERDQYTVDMFCEEIDIPEWCALPKVQPRVKNEVRESMLSKKKGG